MKQKTTLGLIVGTRDFFPAEPVLEARQEVLGLLKMMDIEAVILDQDATPLGAGLAPPRIGGQGGAVILDQDATPLGAVETWEQAKQCAGLFKANRDRIDGILIVLPVFGPERGIADAVKLSELQVPILVQAYPDDLDKMAVELRRDAYCGKISVCNNLSQYGFPFSLTGQHTVHPKTESFKADLRRFVGICRVVRGLKKARLGAVGARPALFNTVRYSEKLLQAYGITVTTVDLSEVFAAASKLEDNQSQVQERLQGIRDYLDTGRVPAPSLVRMAKLGVALDDWIAANELDATAIQCWTSIQQNYGVNACALMSMMSDRLMPSACEVDVTGLVSMYALQLASGKPSALVDWNNNYADDPDKCVLFHCGNWARSFFSEAQMANAEILATVLGTENTYGTVSGQAAPSPMSFARVTTNDRSGRIRTYVGDGEITADKLNTFGSRAVVSIPRLQKLMQYVCKNEFEHHAAMNPSHSAAILAEAFETYFGWDVYYHTRPD